MRMFKLLTTWCFAATLVLSLQPAMAGDGHDHGEKAAPETGMALPRFTAVSDSFEMVGIVNGKQVTIYLDRFADNSPVKDARIELELGDIKVAAAAHDDDDGEYEATLPQELNPGVIPVVATVTVGEDTDLLAGELDLHDAEPTKASDAHSQRWWQKPLSRTLIATLVLALLGWGAWRLRARHKTARNQQPGDAA